MAEVELFVEELRGLIEKSRKSLLGGLNKAEKERGAAILEDVFQAFPDDQAQACTMCVDKVYPGRALKGFSLCRFHIRKIFELT